MLTQAERDAISDKYKSSGLVSVPYRVIVVFDRSRLTIALTDVAGAAIPEQQAKLVGGNVLRLLEEYLGDCTYNTEQLASLMEDKIRARYECTSNYLGCEFYYMDGDVKRKL